MTVVVRLSDNNVLMSGYSNFTNPQHNSILNTHLGNTQYQYGRDIEYH